MDKPNLSPEPSNGERSEWPDATRFYVEDLEALVARHKELIESVHLQHSLNELADDDEWVHVPRWFIERLLEQEKK